MLARGPLVLTLAFGAALAASTPASASQLIDRDAGNARLGVDAGGRALLTYTARGRVRHVLAWGAINAVTPTQARGQVRLRLDYSGGWGTSRRAVWKTFKNTCASYDGPPLAWFVAGCKAGDGSYWAVQAWQRMLPNYGLGRAAPWELRLSHWRGELPVLTIKLDWAYRRFDHLYGSLTYRGRPVYGFAATAGGSPLDAYGRNVYLDTYESAYGSGWHRENSFLLHSPTGAFCYGFYPHGSRPEGKGRKYRATVIGPGVTPDLFWQADALGSYDRRIDLAANEELRALGDRGCRPN